jgi:hypothetical protein
VRSVNDKIVVGYEMQVHVTPAPKGKPDADKSAKPVHMCGELSIPAARLGVGEQGMQTLIEGSLQEAIDEHFVTKVRFAVDDAACHLETMSNLLPDAAKLCVASSVAERVYKDKLTEVVDQYDALDKDCFWTHIVLLQERLVQHNPPEHFVKRCTDNSIWDMVCGNKPGGMAGWERACGFHHRYNAVVSALNRRLWDMKGLEKGDDSYGDFCDSLPLAGRRIVELLLDESEAMWSYDLLKRELDGVQDGKLTSLICDGENYMRMAIEDKVHYFFSVVARELNKRECVKCHETHDQDDINEAGVCIDCQPFDIEED